MILTLELHPLTNGQHVRLSLRVEGGVGNYKFNTDLNSTLLYEGLSETVQNALRRICNELEPRLKRLRNDAISNLDLSSIEKDNT